jgi:hypothetical protein
MASREVRAEATLYSPYLISFLENSLSMYMSLTKVVQDVASSLSNLMQKWKASVAEQMIFAKTVRVYQDDTLALMKVNNEAAVHGFNNISTSLKEINDDVYVTSKHVEALSNTVQHLQIATQNIYSTVNATSEAMGKSANFGGANLNLWVATTLCVFGLYLADRKFAGYFMATCGFAGLFSTLEICERAGTFFIYAQQLLPTVHRYSMDVLAVQSLGSPLLLGVAILCLFILAIWSLLKSTFLHRVQDDQNGTGILPMIEIP